MVAKLFGSLPAVLEDIRHLSLSPEQWPELVIVAKVGAQNINVRKVRLLRRHSDWVTISSNGGKRGYVCPDVESVERLE